VTRATRIIAVLLLACSGAAALAYQMVWTRMFATGLGHEAPAMLAIVAAFMAGMGAGAWLTNNLLARTARPMRWYGLLECSIGAWALISIPLIPAANRFALAITGPEPPPLWHWFIAFVVPLVALVPATFAMGATFPAMERFVALVPGRHGFVGGLYAANTFGAVAGTLAATFVVAPLLGFSRTLALFGIVNVTCGVAACLLSLRLESVANVAAASAGKSSITAEESSRRRASRASHSITIFMTGLLAIGYEVAGTRVLSQVVENTVYTFAIVLSVYLLGTSAGATLYQRFGARRDTRSMSGLLLAGTAWACMLGVLALARSQRLYDLARSLGNSRPAALMAEAVVATAVFALPAVGMGALFSHLVQLARTKYGAIGTALAWNTLGGALAPALFGVALVPTIGSKWTLIILAAIYLAFVRPWTRASTAFGAAALLCVVFIPPNLHVVTTPPGGKVDAFREGVMAAVSVVEDSRGDRVLKVNNRFQMGGTAAADAEYREAHIPLLLHAQPRRCLFLGLGTGITIGGALAHPGVRIEGVELVPEVMDVMALFEPQNRSPEHQSNARLHVADARRFVRTTTNRYDVIVADLFHPARDGAGALYTVEHFRAIRARLTEGGVFCQWLPLHQLDSNTFAVIARTFENVFPNTRAFLLRFNVDAPVLGLIGTEQPLRFAPGAVESRVTSETLREDLRRLALGDSLRLYGLWVDLAPETASHARINTDTDPVVAFDAPASVYVKDPKPYALLIRLINRGGPPDTATATGTNAAFERSLRQYVNARNIYLSGLVHDFDGRRDDAVAAYIESARASEDFTAGYAQCLTIASLLAKADPPKARAILEQLAAAQPSRPVAKQLLKRLSLDAPQ